MEESFVNTGSDWELILLGLTFAAEVAVAAAIFIESETSRRFHFVEKITRDQRNIDRSEIYSEFLAIKGSDRHERSTAFVEEMRGYSKLKRQCDSQIEMFNDLGLIIGTPLGWRKNFYVKIFPHAAVYFWVILRPYILQRREDAGPLFAKPMLTFMKECVIVLIGQGRDFHLRTKEGAIGMTLTNRDLREIRAEIEETLAMV
jgi:hypothetical protein